MVSRRTVCKTPSCSNWAMSFRGSQGLRLEGSEDIRWQGSGPCGEVAPSRPSHGQSPQRGPTAGAGQWSPYRNLPANHPSRGGAPLGAVGPPPAALTPHAGNATPGWWGPAGTAVVSRA